MIELRILKKKDGTEVLQYRRYEMNNSIMGYGYGDWTDVPVVEEE